VVTREYYVKNSQEFIDYVMHGASGPLLAIEAKPLQAVLSDKHAAQLIQYCAVEGVEWAALTNGRELQFFNAYLKGDLSAKRVLRLDLLAFNSEAEFDALFELLWQLSRASMTTPEGVHLWLNRRRMDATIRAVLSDAHSATIKALRKALADAEIRATPQDITQWFASRLDVELSQLPAPVTPQPQHPPTSDPQATAISLPPKPVRRPARAEHSDNSQGRSKNTYYGVSLADLIAAGVLAADTSLVLLKGKQPIANATLSSAGALIYEGRAYRSPSDKTFVALKGGQSMNGWQHWYAELPEGRVSLLELRSRMPGIADRGATSSV
jgi:hypothetical protein